MPMDISEAKLKKLNKRETRGMRHDWYTGLEGLMTTVRILPPDLYDAVMSGDAPVPAGASTPGGGPGNIVPHRHRN
jgi:manganese oxidase